MSTRGAMGFVIDGDEKIAYNHFDSYPDGLGVTILRWLRDADLDETRERVRRLTVVQESKPPTDEQVAELSRYTNLGVSSGSPREWYVLLRETQGDPEATLQAGYMEDGRNFPLDSLFCEWAYVVNLDDDELEVYRGFQTEPGVGRFAGRPTTGKYRPVSLLVALPLDDLPSDEEFVRMTRDRESD